MSEFEVGRLAGWLLAPLVLAIVGVFLWTRIRRTRFTVAKVLGVAGVLLLLMLVGMINRLMRG